jgi:hypothetical protein
MKASKNFVAGLAVGFAASCAVAAASSTTDHNGRFWNTLSRAEKEGYVNGYADAMKLSVSKIDALTIAGDLFRWKKSLKIIKDVETQLSIAEIEPAEAVNRLDMLYRNHSNSELDPGTALQSMANGPAANTKTGRPKNKSREN